MMRLNAKNPWSRETEDIMMHVSRSFHSQKCQCHRGVTLKVAFVLLQRDNKANMTTRLICLPQLPAANQKYSQKTKS